MAELPWSAFYPDVLMSVSGCPDPVVDNHLRRAAIELCAKSRRLKQEMSPFNTSPGLATYPLYTNGDTVVVGILDGAIDGEPLDPVRRDELAPLGNWSTDQGTPTRYFMGDDDATVRLWKTPDGVFSVALALAVKPTRTAAGLEEWFANRYREAVVSGALAGLMTIPGKPWMNVELAAYHAARFQAGVNAATAEAVKDGTRAPLRTVRYGRA